MKRIRSWVTVSEEGNVVVVKKSDYDAALKEIGERLTEMEDTINEASGEGELNVLGQIEDLKEYIENED